MRTGGGMRVVLCGVKGVQGDLLCLAAEAVTKGAPRWCVCARGGPRACCLAERKICMMYSTPDWRSSILSVFCVLLVVF